MAADVGALKSPPCVIAVLRSHAFSGPTGQPLGGTRTNPDRHGGAEGRLPLH